MFGASLHHEKSRGATKAMCEPILSTRNHYGNDVKSLRRGIPVFAPHIHHGQSQLAAAAVGRGFLPAHFLHGMSNETTLRRKSIREHTITRNVFSGVDTRSKGNTSMSVWCMKPRVMVLQLASNIPPGKLGNAFVNAMNLTRRGAHTPRPRLQRASRVELGLVRRSSLISKVWSIYNLHTMSSPHQHLLR